MLGRLILNTDRHKGASRNQSQGGELAVVFGRPGVGGCPRDLWARLSSLMAQLG